MVIEIQPTGVWIGTQTKAVAEPDIRCFSVVTPDAVPSVQIEAELTLINRTITEATCDEHRTLTIVAAPSIVYGQIVEVMRISRESGWPDIVFRAGTARSPSRTYRDCGAP